MGKFLYKISFPWYVGENIFASTGFFFTMDQAVIAWFNENVYFNYSTNNCQNGQVCGHCNFILTIDTQVKYYF